MGKLDPRKARASDLKETPIAARLSMATRFRTKYRKRTPVDYIMASLDGARDSKRAVLDIGCGAGDYLTSLDSRFTPYGIELSKGLAAMAQAAFEKRGGRVVQAATVEALPQFPADSIDAVVMRSYLEHEPRAREVLEGRARSAAQEWRRCDQGSKLRIAQPPHHGRPLVRLSLPRARELLHPRLTEEDGGVRGISLRTKRARPPADKRQHVGCSAQGLIRERRRRRCPSSERRANVRRRTARLRE